MFETLQTLVPPAVTPVSVADMLLQCRCDPDDTAAQTVLADYLAAATEYCEAYLKLSLVQRQYLWTVDYFPNRIVQYPTGQLATQYLNSRLYPYTQNQIVLTPKPPLVSVDSIVYLDTSGTSTTMPPAGYRAIPGTPGRLVPTTGSTWPNTQSAAGAITITLTCGYSPDGTLVPAKVKQAIKLLAAFEYRNREPANGITKERVQDLLNGARYGGVW